MKKILTGVMILCLMLTACGGGKSKQAGNFDPATDAKELLDSGAFDDVLTEVDQTTACNLYGIDEKDVTSCAVYSSPSSADELAIFALTDAAAAKAAAEQFSYRVEDRIDELTNYLPDELPKLEKAVIKTRDNTALLVIAGDYGPVETFLDQ